MIPMGKLREGTSKANKVVTSEVGKANGAN